MNYFMFGVGMAVTVSCILLMETIEIRRMKYYEQ